jgi:hypothetical protein
MVTDPIATFRASFGDTIAGGTTYSDPMGWHGAEIQMKSIGRPKGNSRLQDEWAGKALLTTSGGAGTAGYALVPVYVDPVIVDRSRKETPLVEMFARVANMGTTADFNVITAKGTAAYDTEDSARTEANDTEDRVSKAIKYLYSTGRVSGPMQAAMPGYTITGFTESLASTAKQKEIVTKTIALKEAEEDGIINGNSGTTAAEIDGFIYQQSTTNKTDKNTTAIELDDIYDSCADAFDDGGKPNLAVCASSVFTDVQKLLSDYIRGAAPIKTFAWGFDTMAMRTITGEMPVIPSMFMSNVAGSKEWWNLDMRYIENRVLQDVTYEELAKSNDGQKFMLKLYHTLINRAPAFCSFVGEIS